MSNERFHRPPDKYFENISQALQRAIDDGRITEGDSDLIREYIAETSSRLSPGRQYKTAYTLITVRKFLPEYARTKKIDLFEGINRMRYARKDDGTPYKQNTIADYVRFTKRFYKWLSERAIVDIPLKVIEDIKSPAFDVNSKSDDCVITPEELQRLINAAKTNRYKALIGVMYEAGLRSIEVASLRWDDIQFYEWGAKLRTTGKTGKQRSVPIIIYREYLAKWRSEYPGDPSGNNYVFITTRGDPLQYRGLAKAIERFRVDAGIERKITLHSFRHSRVTHCLRSGMQETLAKRAFWGNTNTKMLQTYEHLVERDIDDAFASMAGVEIDDTMKDVVPEPVICAGCHMVMPPGSRFCARCGAGLTREAIKDAEHAKAILLKRVDENPALAFHILNTPGE
ncbi:site-specific integrase [Methanocalculus sp. MSAO_Arc2]|uniref:tyrosine-type recombinase/integrase n=1 Tax=Methanocalculus sp. MSAO_Arc2 TaxID=2293855 RepID=UPI0026B3CC1F